MSTKEYINTHPVPVSFAVAAATIAFYVLQWPWWASLVAGGVGFVVGLKIGR